MNSLLVLLVVLAVFFVAWFVSVRKGKQRLAKELAALRGAWAKPIERERDLEPCQSVLRARGLDSRAQYLDDLTWRDLDLDLVFAQLDRTYSLPGECELYCALRVPEATADLLKNHDRIISLFQTDALSRECLQLHLSRLGRTRYAYGLVDLLWGEIPPRSRLSSIYSLLAVLAAVWLVATIILGVFGGPWPQCALLALAVLFPVHLFVHYRTRRVFSDRILSIRYLSKLVTTGLALAGTRIPGLEEPLRKLRHYSAAARRIPTATAALVPERGGAVEFVDALQEYLAIFFLIEARGFYAVLDEIRRSRDALCGLFMTIGELDLLQAVASFREGLGSYAKPEFQVGGASLELKDAYHPLLKSPVCNSISLSGRGCLITGSNMSGKSTFLRTLGVNAVLAQSVYTAPAGSYKGAIFRIISSLVRSDDLVEGKSYYLFEAERLLAMLSVAEGATPALCLVDEPLRGTNSTERLAASEAILECLAHRNALVVTATHDLQLVDRLAQSYECRHFVDHVDETGLHFDYRLRPGKATTTNAIRLLEYLGYPAEIIEKARDKSLGGAVRAS